MTARTPDEAAIRAAVRAKMDTRDREVAERKAVPVGGMWPYLVFALALVPWTLLWVLFGFVFERTISVDLHHGWPYAAWVVGLVVPPGAFALWADAGSTRRGKGEAL